MSAITNDTLLEKAAAIINPRKTGDDLMGDVGCALLTDQDHIYLGVCIDVGSGIGFCAEHSAIGAMVTAGEYRIVKIVAVWKDEKDTYIFIFHIDPEQIRVQDPQTGYHLEMSNRAVVRQSDGELLGLGDPDEKVLARRQALEQSLQAQALPIAAILGGYLTMPPAAAASPFSFLAYLMSIAYLAYYVGRLLWMLLVGGLVPYYYRLCMLQGTHDRLSRIDQMLARAVWGSSRSG